MSEVKELTDTYHTPNYRRIDRVFVRGEGSYLFDEEGRKYLDFLTGISVTVLGHSDPGVVAAVVKQAEKLFHVSNLFYVPSQAALLKELAAVFPWKGKVFFCNSGSEAVEGAIKLVRKYRKDKGKGGHKIVSFRGSFHGRTYGSLSATAQEKFHAGFEPMLPGFAYVERGDREGYLEALDDGACGVIFEPIQGEVGVIPFEREFLDFVCREAGERDVVVICDEIQSGMGRTGTFFAFEQFGIVPQVITMAKGIANGLPLGVVAAIEDVASSFTPGSHGSTFGGNPVSCAAAVEVVSRVRAPGFLDQVAETGSYLRENLESLAGDLPGVVEVRGMGLMQAIALSAPCRKLVERILDRGLIVNCAEETVLRLLPPLTVKGEEVDEAVGILRSVLEEGVS